MVWYERGSIREDRQTTKGVGRPYTSDRAPEIKENRKKRETGRIHKVELLVLESFWDDHDESNFDGGECGNPFFIRSFLFCDLRFAFSVFPLRPPRVTSKVPGVVCTSPTHLVPTAFPPWAHYERFQKAERRIETATQKKRRKEETKRKRRNVAANPQGRYAHHQRTSTPLSGHGMSILRPTVQQG